MISRRLLGLMFLMVCGSTEVLSDTGIGENTTILAGEQRLYVEQIAEGLGVPWGMAFIDEHRMIVTERDGAILLLDVRTGNRERVQGAPEVLASGQGGMLDVAVPPDHASSGWIYLTYVKDVDIDSDGATVLARAKLKGNRLVELEDLLVTDSATDTGRHFGSRITFDGQGHVFFGVGDRGERENAQDLSNHAGSIMRLMLDGSIPDDNPHADDPRFLPEVCSVGHRNPQGLVYDIENQRLWELEHGPRGGDELNFIRCGANYGWPVISYGKEYWGPISVGEGTHKAGMEQPVKQYTPSIAPGSLLLYTGDAIPSWKGNLFAGALKLTHLNRLVISGQATVQEEERLLGELEERIRALAQSPDGLIYFSTDSGKIARLRPE